MVQEYELGSIMGMPVVVQIEANHPAQFNWYKKRIDNHFAKMSDAYLEKYCGKLDEIEKQEYNKDN